VYLAEGPKQLDMAIHNAHQKALEKINDIARKVDYKKGEK